MARSKQVSGVREIRTLRSKWRELETGDGSSYAGTKLETAVTAKEEPARTAPALDPTTAPRSTLYSQFCFRDPAFGSYRFNT